MTKNTVESIWVKLLKFFTHDKWGNFKNFLNVVGIIVTSIISITAILVYVYNQYKEHENQPHSSTTLKEAPEPHNLDQSGSDSDAVSKIDKGPLCTFSKVVSEKRTYVVESIDDIVRNVTGGNDVQSVKNFDDNYKGKWVRLTTRVNFQGRNNTIKSVVNCGSSVGLVVQMNQENVQLSKAASYANGSKVTLDAKLERYHPQSHISLKNAEFSLLPKAVGNAVPPQRSEESEPKQVPADLPDQIRKENFLSERQTAKFIAELLLNADGWREQFSVNNMVSLKSLPPPGWTAIVTKLPIERQGRFLVEAKDLHSDANLEIFLKTEGLDIAPGDLVLANGVLGSVYITNQRSVWMQINATSLDRVP